ncbi:MAG: TonB-dependent receptor [Balneolaceae bacterium]
MKRSIRVTHLWTWLIKTIAGFSLLFFVAALPVMGQQATIEGTVFDNENNPLPGANVIIQGTQTGAFSGTDGTYRLQVQPGTMTLQVSFLGFRTFRQEVTLQAGETRQINVTLQSSVVGSDEVVVLGSRRQGRTVTQSPVPVDVITAEEVQASGFSQTTQIIRSLIPSFNAPESSITDGTDHVRPATLRGLGPDQTLVLINGKRRHTSAILHVNGSVGRGATGVDLNAIPSNMIERIEVLRDGAAAQYGSDALAGVINIVLKQSPGFDGSFSYGQHASRETRGFERNEGVPEGASPFGFIDSQFYEGPQDVWRLDGKTVNLHLGYGFELPNNGNLYISGQLRDRGNTNRSGLDPRQQFFNLPDGSLNPQEFTFDRNNHRFGQGEIRDISGFFNGRIELTEDATLYAFGGMSFREGETGGFYRRALDDRTLRAFYPQGFLPLITTDIYDGSVAAGVRGNKAGWNYDISQTYGHNNLEFGVKNSVNTSMGVGSPTRFRAGTLSFDMASTNADIVRSFDIGLAQPLNVAMGAEFRYELYRLGRGDAESFADGGVPILDGPNAGNPAAVGSQVFPGFGPQNEQNEDRYSIGLYLDLETNVTDEWLVGLAGRFESYDDFGNEFTGKFTTRYEIMEGLAVRGAISSGFRAPSLAQSFFSSIATVFIDGVPFEVGTFPVSSPVAQALGAESLEAETSVNYSAGFTYERGNFSLTTDLYLIDIDDRVVFTENFTGPDIADFLQNQGINANGGRFFTNAVDTRTQGIDVIARYGLELGAASQLRLTAAYNYNETEIRNKDEIQTPENLQALTDTPLFGRQEIGRFERGQPNASLNLSSTLTRNRLNLTTRVTRYGKFKNLQQDPANSLFDQEFGSVWTTDVELGYELGHGFRWAVGANNLFDKFPDKQFQANSFNGIFQYSGFSPSGFGGRYVYSRITVNI